jgi:hypothetical protein
LWFAAGVIVAVLLMIAAADCIYLGLKAIGRGL